MDGITDQFVINLEVKSNEDNILRRRRKKIRITKNTQLRSWIVNKIFTVVIVFSLLCMNCRYIDIDTSPNGK